ncbi:MAG: hypothetical protein EOO73_21215 [Myxococcales bacterium]|nr:MAG: hypothetical protein EOO73_21215 [Myxococcales bacterium]
MAACASLGLHAALLLSVTVVVREQAPSTLQALPNSVAMPGNAIEIEAPTPELAATPASPAAVAVAAPVDVESLPPEPPSPPDPGPSPVETAKPANAAKPKAVTPKASKPLATPRPPSPRAESESTPSSGADSTPSGAPAAGTFGQEGLAPGVRRLGYAFTRALPAATPADPEWRELPAGHVGTIRIALTVDENNRLGAVERWQSRPGEPTPPAVLQRMVERTLVLLRAGQFALSGSNQPGSERLVIDVTLRDEAAEDEPTETVVQKRFDGASPGRPGKAYFRYGTGRAFEAKITIAASGSK